MLEIKLDTQFQDFHLQVEQQLPTQQVIGLFGPSGSGKSKFIRQIVGLENRDLNSGKICFKQRCWLDTRQNLLLDTAQRGIGYLPQTVDLFPHLTVAQNIRYSLVHGRRRADKINLELLLKQLDIESLQDRLPAQLSGGQKQRVGLARAILAADNLLLLDEPLSAQGETHKSEIMSYLKALNQDHQLSIIFASHNRIEHAFLSQYLVTFNQGKIIQSADYELVATNIAEPFAQTNDAINHLQASAVSYDEQFYLNLIEHAGHSLWAGEKALKKGSKVLLEIKATDISLSKSSNHQTSILNCIPVNIADFHQVSNHQYLVKLAFAECFLTTFITKKSFVELQLVKGMSLYAQFKSVSVLPFELLPKLVHQQA